MTRLFTHSYDVREEKPVDKSLFDLLTSKKGKEWCAIYIPIGPVIKRPPHWANLSGRETFAYEDERLVAVNWPQPWINFYPAEIYDIENERVYYIDNAARTVRTRERFSGGNFGHISKISSHMHFRFKGTVDEIVEEFRRHGYKLQSY